MKYFTKEEARVIMNHNGLGLCLFYEENPNLEAMKALDELIRRNSSPNKRLLNVCAAFILGRATGIREERARRKQKQEVAQR